MMPIKVRNEAGPMVIDYRWQEVQVLRMSGS